MEQTFIMSLKIYWSIFWRSFFLWLIVMLAFFGIYLLGTIIILLMKPQMNAVLTNAIFIFSVFFLVVAFFIITFYIYRWALNCLPFIVYREGRVCLMREEITLLNYNLFDAICVFWSVTWRALVLSIPLCIIELFLLFNLTPNGNILINLINIVLGIFAFYWMLKLKRTGRWLRLEFQQQPAISSHHPHREKK